MSTLSRHSDIMSTDYDHLFKLLVVGDSGVGKSSLVQRYADDVYRDCFIPTIGVNFKIRSFVTDTGRKVKLQIWDTAGQDRFRSIAASYYRCGHGIVLCYDTTDVNSFRNMSRVWLKEIANYAREDVRVMIVGTKADVADSRRKARATSTSAGGAESKDRSDVGAGGGSAPKWSAPAGTAYGGEGEWDEEAEAMAMAEELGVPLFRCSAKTGKGVEDLFTAVAQQLIGDHVAPRGYSGAGGVEPLLGSGTSIRVEEGVFSKLGCVC